MVGSLSFGDAWNKRNIASGMSFLSMKLEHNRHWFLLCLMARMVGSYQFSVNFILTRVKLSSFNSVLHTWRMVEWWFISKLFFISLDIGGYDPIGVCIILYFWFTDWGKKGFLLWQLIVLWNSWNLYYEKSQLCIILVRLPNGD